MDIRGLLPGALAAPIMPTITCLNGCTAGNVLHPVQLVPQPGQVQILDLTRLGTHGPVNPFLPGLIHGFVTSLSVCLLVTFSQFKDF